MNCICALRRDPVGLRKHSLDVGRQACFTAAWHTEQLSGGFLKVEVNLARTCRANLITHT